MTPDEFIACGQRAFGPSGWQKSVAAVLGMRPATISNYKTGRANIPPVVAVAMRSLAPWGVGA